VSSSFLCAGAVGAPATFDRTAPTNPTKKKITDAGGTNGSRQERTAGAREITGSRQEGMNDA
jgi:hypothetical protein